MTERSQAVHVPDVNVLVARLLVDHVHHEVVSRWWSGVDRIALTPITESGLVRLLLNPAVVLRTTATASVLSAVDRLRSSHRVEFRMDDTSLTEPLVNLDGLVGHRQTTDFHLLNLAVRWGGTLVTLDGRLERAVHRDDRRHLEVLVP